MDVAKLSTAVLLATAMFGGSVALAQDRSPVVVVRQVIGVDETGNARVLMRDPGVVTHLDTLPKVVGQVVGQVKAKGVAVKGTYRDLRVVLADDSWDISRQGLALREDIAAENRTVRLDGAVRVNEHSVIPEGLNLPAGGAGLKLNAVEHPERFG